MSSLGKTGWTPRAATPEPGEGRDDVQTPSDGFVSQLRARWRLFRQPLHTRAREQYPAVPGEELRNYDLTRIGTARPIASPPAYQGDTGHCIPGTRTNTLTRIVKWADDIDGRFIFWLHGMAGSGKSAIARTATSGLWQRGHDVVSLTLRDDGISSRPVNLFRSISLQLRKILRVDWPVRDPSYPGPTTAGNPNEWFEFLLSDPLRMLVETVESKFFPRDSSKRLLIVVDLDGCLLDIEIGRILMLLSELRWFLPGLGILLVSRPEYNFQRSIRLLDATLHEEYALEEVEHGRTEEDIGIYIDSRFKTRPSHICPQRDGLAWPSKGQIKALVNIATPFFTVAAGICDDILEDDETVELKMQQMIERPPDVLPSHRLLYQPIWNKTIEHVLSRSNEKGTPLDLKSTVGAILLLAEPLPLGSLSSLLGISLDQILNHLSCLHSVISVPNAGDMPIAVLHDSFRAFLLDGSVNLTEIHVALADKCLENLAWPGNLREDLIMCGDPAVHRADIDQTQIAQCIGTVTAYACRYWAFHFYEGRTRLTDDSPLHISLRTHFLSWLEAMVWLGELSTVDPMLRTLRYRIEPGPGSYLRLFIEDARSFVGRVGHVINRTPLQLYRLALECGLAPNTERWFSNAKYVDMEQLFNGGFGRAIPQPITLAGHNGSTPFMAFSPDGAILASTSADYTTQLWHVSTGRVTTEMPKERDGPIQSVFSPNGHMLMTASLSGRVTYRNIDGDELAELSLLQDGEAPVDFAFAGITLAYAYADHLELWNAVSGKKMFRFVIETGVITAVCLSLDGQHVLLSVSRDDHIHPEAHRTELGWLTCISSHVQLSTLSLSGQDGQLNVATSEGTTVLISTDSPSPVSLSHGGHIERMSFSPNGKELVTASEDRVILWDVQTGQRRREIEGPRCAVTSLAFSPDATQIAVSLRDGTIHFWRVQERPVEGAEGAQSWGDANVSPRIEHASYARFDEWRVGASTTPSWVEQSSIKHETSNIIPEIDRQIVRDLFCTPQLKSLCTAALKDPRISVDVFQQDLSRLIHDFGINLRKEADTDSLFQVSEQLSLGHLSDLVADELVKQPSQIEEDLPVVSTTQPYPMADPLDTRKNLIDLLEHHDEFWKHASIGSSATSYSAEQAPRTTGSFEAGIKDTKVSRRRTKTGCLTCRKRRIKCDEARPVCQNCIKSRRQCEGYGRPITFKPTFHTRPATVDFGPTFNARPSVGKADDKTDDPKFSIEFYGASRSGLYPLEREHVDYSNETSALPIPVHSIQKSENPGISSVYDRLIGHHVDETLISSAGRIKVYPMDPNNYDGGDIKGFLLHSKAYAISKLQLLELVHEPYVNLIYAAVGSSIFSDLGTKWNRGRNESSRKAISREIACIPPQRLALSTQVDLNILDQFKCFVEDTMGESWVWWPLGPRKYTLPAGYCRLSWRTPCEATRYIDLPKSAADKVIEATQWAPEFIKMASNISDDSTCAAATGSSAAADAPVVPGYSSRDQQWPTGQQEFGNGQTSTDAKPPSTEIPRHKQATNRHLYLGIRSGSSYLLSVLRTDLMKSDVEFFRELKEQYIKTRGTLRLWFSMWRYDHCQFYRFRKYGINLYSPTRIDYPPDTDGLYEFIPRPMDDRPPEGPISECEWRDHFYRSCCPRPCGSWHRHRLRQWVFSANDDSALHALPKRIEELELQDGRREEFWGVFARERRGFAWVLAYAILCNLPGVVFFFLWLFRWGHAADLQDGAVPVGLSVSITAAFVAVLYESRERER